MARRLVDGLYENLVTEELQSSIASNTTRAIDVGGVRHSDANVPLARFLHSQLDRALADVSGTKDEKLARQTEVANEILRVLISRGLITEDQLISPPSRELLSVYADPTLVPLRPEMPLATSTLLTLGQGDPRIGNELAREILSADRVDALVSFITVGGVRQIRDAIDVLCRRHRRGSPPVLRIITTTYIGATEASAVEELSRLDGVQIKISYDGRRTRLHAKAWLFHRDSGLSTAYVGSANLSAPALTAGLEWMMKASAGDLPEVVKKFAGAFDTLWADSEFELFDPLVAEQSARLRGALDAAGKRDETRVLTFFDLKPYKFQEEILDRLHAEREIHGQHRNLIVAATGTGKTVIAAFDYARCCAAAKLRPRLLFLAHRKELLSQAMDTFRLVLRDSAFGALLTGDEQPGQFEHLFATIQTVRSRKLVSKLGTDYWRYVVVDECHHLPADSYQDVVPALEADVLLGLTATPERTDGRSLLGDFGGRVAAELRLWHALDRQLLVPFDYYGINDQVSEAELGSVRWSRTGGYNEQDLDALYTGNHVRADRILAEVKRKRGDLLDMRALGFCVSVKHAQFMAEHFTRHGIPAASLSGQASDAERTEARRRLGARAINVIFTCDLYNEGVDLPFVDTLLLLRPTESPTIFLQQLGRGLRLHEGKAVCLVLDFIGQHREEFRFDGLLAGATGLPRSALVEATEAGFPFLPRGCAISLDPIARETVLRSLRASVEATWKRLVAEASSIAGTRHELGLDEFLKESGHELSDLYMRGSWTKLKRDAGLTQGKRDVEDAELDLCHRIGRLLHIDDHQRLVTISSWLGTKPPANVNRQEALMFAYQLRKREEMMAGEDVVPWLRSLDSFREELKLVTSRLADEISLPPTIRPVAEWPLAVHRRYTRFEILTACGDWTATRKVPNQQGIRRLDDQKREILFVTLNKSDGGFSPSTRYRDYAISPELFHWETQNSVAEDSETAMRYRHHANRGWSIHLFVQTKKGVPFSYLGPVKFDSARGSRPVSILWRLEYAMPPGLFSQYQTLGGG